MAMISAQGHARPRAVALGAAGERGGGLGVCFSVALRFTHYQGGTPAGEKRNAGSPETDKKFDGRTTTFDQAQEPSTGE